MKKILTILALILVLAGCPEMDSRDDNDVDVQLPVSINVIGDKPVPDENGGLKLDAKDEPQPGKHDGYVPLFNGKDLRDEIIVSDSQILESLFSSTKIFINGTREDLSSLTLMNFIEYLKEEYTFYFCTSAEAGYYRSQWFKQADNQKSRVGEIQWAAYAAGCKYVLNFSRAEESDDFIVMLIDVQTGKTCFSDLLTSLAESAVPNETINASSDVPVLVDSQVFFSKAAEGLKSKVLASLKKGILYNLVIFYEDEKAEVEFEQILTKEFIKFNKTVLKNRKILYTISEVALNKEFEAVLLQACLDKVNISLSYMDRQTFYYTCWKL
jgi:hypothetical protein